MIRTALALFGYLGLTWLLLVMFCVWPKQALALVSPQAYSRVVAQAEWIAYQAASRSATVLAVATAAGATSPASMAIRAVTGPVGWTALGVMAGVALYQTYYPSSTLQSIQTAAAALNASYTILDGNGNPASYPASSVHVTPATFTVCETNTGWDAEILGTFVWPLPAHWGSRSGAICHASGTSNGPVAQAGSPATVPQLQTYVGSLPAGDSKSIESNSKPLGSNGPAPDSASDVQIVPVSPAQMPSTVKPSSQVGPSDITIADHVPPPAGSTTTNPTTEQSTTTTTTTTNPDGSKTETKQTTASTSCTAPGGHESRTMGTVLAQHQATWNSSGLIGAVNLLKNLTWPTTLPVVDLPSTFFGTQHVDFNQWAWFFTALRTLVIAIASLAAYRIIFVGGN